MALTIEQIKKFEAAMQGPGPEGDPDWKVTQGLLKLVVVQGKEILSLQEQIEALDESMDASSEAMMNSLQQGMGVGVAGSGLNDEQVKTAVGSLDTAIKAHEAGMNIAKYAGTALKFAAMFI